MIFKGLKTLLLSLIALLILASAGYAQTSQDVYGKNRIQYKKFEWEFISSPNFDIYFTKGNISLAKNAAQHAELEFDQITELIGFAPYQKIKLFIYASKSDLRQSNVGLNDENNLTGGRTNFSKSIVEIPYPGNQLGFQDLIRLGIAKTLLYEMVYGGSFKESIQNSYLLTLPEWYLGGAAAYAAYGWNAEMDDYMRDALSNNTMRKPSNLLGKEAVIAGQSIWNYIAERYGKQNVSNILNLTRVIRNEESSIANTLGVDYDKLLVDWRSWYLNQALRVNQSNTPLPRSWRLRSNSRFATLNQVKLSSDGKWAAYSMNKDGRYSIQLRNLETGRNKLITLKGNKVLAQSIDAKVPLLAWQGSEVLHAVITKNGTPHLYSYPIGKGESTITPIKGATQISSFDVATDGKLMVMSADKNGQTDLYFFYPTSKRLLPITFDLADDLDPRFVPGTRLVVFSSNRISDTLGSKYEHKDLSENFNIYQINPDTQNLANRSVLTKITNFIYSETQPIPLNTDTLIYLSNESGIANLVMLRRSTGEKRNLTKYQSSIINYDIANPVGANVSFAFTAQTRGRELPFATTKFSLESNEVPYTTARAQMLAPWLQNRFGNVSDLVKPDSSWRTNALKALEEKQLKIADSIDKGFINFRYYVFDSEKYRKPVLNERTPSASLPTSKSNLAITGSVKYPLSGVQGPFRYENRLSLNSVTTTLIIDPLQRTATVLEANVTDLFENHKFVASLTNFLDLNSNRFALEYQYLPHRLDFRTKYYRNNYYYTSSDGFASERYILSRVDATVAYPFGTASSVSLSPQYMRTKYIKVFDGQQATLASPDILQNYIGYRLEYNFDNTIGKGLNMLEGMRIRLKLETNNNFADKRLSFNNLSIDFRRYQKIHKELIFAVRGSYGRFFGNNAKQYLVGGMDNWLFASSNTTPRKEDPLSDASGFTNQGRTNRLFNQYVTNLRGFDYNTLYGKSYLLCNMELRFPIVRYLYKGPIESNFLKHFQLNFFYDIGTAWDSGNPFNGNNSVNTRIIDTDPSYKITIRNFDDPFIRSYGLGFRTMMLGYYTKFDLAQGIQNGVFLRPMLHVTLGSDF
jgi:Tol biopolymer transport system component